VRSPGALPPACAFRELTPVRSPAVRSPGRPDALVGQRIYEPGDSGFERELAARMAELDRKKQGRE
jgi:hypothetical protein